eukprot:CAMPEP_0119275438 /NCGR_PEP_ID=MMETSP1329-20130426/13733_1 /TAXON_ID=114041 /ORGANISM="Genus nov. species nov., Strain RCC1024" /LENGTH=612 /DNA_ID=CAMNT_0007275821 /DNA_START=202 /DNA_END=2036 /DNA_ORIENTATION=-
MRAVLRSRAALRAPIARDASTAAAAALPERHRSRVYDRRNLEFLLFEQDLARHAGDREVVSQMLDTADSFIDAHMDADAIADANEATWDPSTGRVTLPESTRAFVDAQREGGFSLMSVAEEDGGLGLSFLASSAVSSAVGCGATSGLWGFTGLTGAAANLIKVHGTERQVAELFPPLIDGRWMGTMALSETHAGSSLADIRAKATPVEGGRSDEYRLRGSKMWTSGYDHDLSENILHLVLAKIDGPDTPPGAKGISLFAVPKFLEDGTPNDISLDGLNHKMGQRGLPNSYWSMDGAVGYLVGERPHSGLPQMFTMMNEMRVAVGLHAACCGVRGLCESLLYAKERVQGTALGSRSEVAIVEHADVRRQLLAQKALSEGALHLCLMGAALVDDVRGGSKSAALLLETLTPIIKAWPSEWALEANKWAIQVLGGYGYTRDYPMERLYRDNRLNMIHEGTNGVQGLDLLGRKMMADNGAGAKALATTMGAAAAHVIGDECLSDVHDLAHSLIAAVQRWVTTTTMLGGLAASDPTRALANAHEFLNMTGHTVVAWLWLREAAAAAAALENADASEVAFYQGKIHTARYFYNHELEKTVAQASLLQSFEDSTLLMRP